MQCSQCQHENPPGAKFCLECGARLTLACAQCGVQLPPGAKFCLECGASSAASTPSAAPPHPPAMVTPAPAADGERRQLTILFSDLVGSTELSTQLDPEEWRDRVAQYHRATADVVTRFGGYVAKYLGDGVLALFGYPQAQEDDAERAVRAGLAIMEAVRGLGEEKDASPLSVRIGIHTGLTVIADAGGKADVFGETPNVAARVQSAAEPDTLLVSAATQRLVSGLFVVEDRGAQQLKGIERPVQLYRVSGAGVARRRSRAHGLTPFVGRDDELRLMLSRWERARAGEGQVVLVMGEPGIGKSRLLEEFSARITPDRHLWLECAGQQFFANTPFHAITQMLDHGLGWRGDESTEERVSRLERALEPAGLKLGEAVPLIAEMLNLPIPTTYPPLLFSPDQRRKRLFGALAGWVFGATRLQPLVIAIEDLHWVDPSTLEFLQTLVEQGATAPLLLLQTARPEFRASWSLRAHHAQITLNRLNDRHTRAMIAGVVARVGLAQDVIERVIQRTDGVPLFAEELTRLLLEGDGHAAARAIPATLHDSLTARLDRLGSAKEVAQLGAVLGREFSYEVLQAVSPLPEDALRAALTTLAAAELLYVRGIPPKATYEFKHALIQDAAYAALLKSTRRDLHRRAAHTITERFGALAEAQPQVLARHWSDAGEAEPAVAAWTKAAHAANARHAFKEAEEGYRQALAMLSTQPESSERDARELELAMPLGMVMYATRGWNASETVEAVARVRALAEKGGNLLPLVLQGAANCLAVWTSGDYASAAALADQTLDLARREGSDISLRFAHQAQFLVRFLRGDLVGAEEHFGLWSAICEAAGYGQFPAEGTGGMGYGSLFAWTLGHADAARERIAQATALARETQNPYDLAVGLVWETRLYVWLREPEHAVAAATEAFPICDEHGFSLFGVLARLYLGGARAQLASAGEAVVLIREGVASLVALGCRNGIPCFLTWQAGAQALGGAIADALATVEDALAANPEELVYRPQSLTCRGELRLQLGQGELAEADFRDAVALARTMRAKVFELRATTSLVRMLRDTGRRDEARTLLAEIYGWFTEGFDTRDLVDAKALLEEL